MMLEENTNKVVIAADIRNQTKCYKQGAMGNYSTAFSVSVKKNEENVSYSITNLEKFQSNIIAEAVFIPPASPANKKTWGVLTVNRHMKICTSDFIAER